MCSSENAVVFGLQWGDEGKGKVATFLSRHYDLVVRYAGGSNAGHTVDYGDFKLIHHLVPSFDVRRNVAGYVANGVVLDLSVLRSEIEEIQDRFDLTDRLFVSNLAHVVLRVHKDLDSLMELKRGGAAIGTTKRGIGPAYADRVHRLGLRLCDFSSCELLQERVATLNHVYGELYGVEPLTNAEIEKLLDDYRSISDFVVAPLEFKRTLRDSRVLFESTQGVLLDVDFGTYPFVTSVNCGPSGIEAGVGFRINVGRRIGVFKAYTTRVGAGPFPTELRGGEGDELREAGGEYGATTGRPRRCGWLDLPLLRYAVEVSGCDEMVMTKADVLSGREKVKVGVRYRLGGRAIDVPTTLDSLANVDVEYVEFPGWGSLTDAKFTRFLAFVESEVGVKVKFLSTGSRVDDVVEI